MTAADVQRVAQKYFTKENRAVAIWTRKGGTAPEDPALAALPDQAKPMVKQMLSADQDSTDTDTAPADASRGSTRWAARCRRR